MFGNNIKELGLGLVLKEKGTAYVGKVAGEDMDNPLIWTMYLEEYIIIPRKKECPLFVEGVLQKDMISSFYEQHKSLAITEQIEIDSSRSDARIEYVHIVE